MVKKKNSSFGVRLKKDMKRYRGAYLLVVPVVVFYLLFCYKPMYGVIIAFKDFSPAAGIWGSDWTGSFGFQHLIHFFGSFYFKRVLRNTLVISLTSILFGFPAPIIFALLLNEIKSEKFKRITQTISYMPHFISTVVICGMLTMFVSEKGFITQLLTFLGGEGGVSLLSKEEYFVPIYVISGIWQEVGWGAIIYLAALSGIDQQLYEAAQIDGANRWKQMIHVTLPGISGQIIIIVGVDEAAQVAELVKYALIVVSTAPILAVYPFLQKYFVKGVMIGAIKG